ncbi:hypothetical protein EZS27_004848 [termite gut metagenome]|uniref:Uncharacterized protein n=1 Tax=termite gut metagenome TaxID=433724 RepID=A0A5J4SNH3_9ZZZZ
MEKNTKEIKSIKINEGREKSNTRNITTPRPLVSLLLLNLIRKKVDF